MWALSLHTEGRINFELFKSIHHVHSNKHVLKEEICLALKISKFYAGERSEPAANRNWGDFLAGYWGEKVFCKVSTLDIYWRPHIYNLWT